MTLKNFYWQCSISLLEGIVCEVFSSSWDQQIQPTEAEKDDVVPLFFGVLCYDHALFRLYTNCIFTVQKCVYSTIHYIPFKFTN